MQSVFMGEMLGTATLVFLGDGVVASVLLKDSKGEGAGWLAITAGWAFAVVCGVLVAQAAGSADAHINPAVSLFAALISGQWSLLASHVPAQFLGAFIGATLMCLNYYPHFSRTPDAGLKLATFCTAPATPGRLFAGISEALATMMLLLVITAIASPGVDGRVFGPMLVGLTVWAIGLGLGGATGYALNPARDLAPRIAHALLPIPGKGDSNWGYAAIPVLGPCCGALLAAVVARSTGLL